jgi:hypothetical protein
MTFVDSGEPALKVCESPNLRRELNELHLRDLTWKASITTHIPKELRTASFEMHTAAT